MASGPLARYGVEPSAGVNIAAQAIDIDAPIIRKESFISAPKMYVELILALWELNVKNYCRNISMQLRGNFQPLAIEPMFLIVLLH